MEFHQRGHVEFVREPQEILEFVFREAFGDQKDRIGSRSASFPDLVFIDDEVLAEDWQGHLCANFTKVF